MEINRGEVYIDMIDWLDEKVEKQQEEMTQPAVVESIDEVVIPTEETPPETQEEKTEE